MPSIKSRIAAITQPNGDRRYVPSSRRKMILIARIGSSDQTDERVLQLAPGVVELEQIELGHDHGAADLGAAVLGGGQREQQAAALLVRIGDALHAIDRGEHAADLALGII